MLSAISINNFILIERLDMELSKGLTVMTGETGAGKSILLDAVAFAVGAKGGAELVMQGRESASVALSFVVAKDSLVRSLLSENGIEGDDIVIRRTMSAVGKGRIFINDIPVSVALAKEVGEALVEIHGQFDNRSILNPATHLGMLDSFWGLGAEATAVREAWRRFADARQKREAAATELEQAKKDEDYIRYNLEELDKLAPTEGEETGLDAARRAAMAGEKISGVIADASARLLSGGAPPEKFLADCANVLERLPADSKTDKVAEVLSALSHAAAAAADAGAVLEQLATASCSLLDPRELDKIEVRLFKIRELARKHRVQPDGLPAIRVGMRQLLSNINNSDEALHELIKAETEAHEKYLSLAKALSAKRATAAKKLSKAVMGELAPLKLAKALFEVQLDPAEEGASGLDKAQFVGATNAGAKSGLIHKIASGGELARFTLAIKAVISGGNEIGTMIFDEVDSGISGATASAVGERLVRLGQAVQTLVVTHSPQVAAKGAAHFRVTKAYDEAAKLTRTTLAKLNKDERVNEVARIISGDKITKEAIAAARQLF